MKRFVGTLSFLLALLLLSNVSLAEEVVLKVGATPVPHAQILGLVKDDLKKSGIKLEIKEFTDYVAPNIALDNGDIDANYFQHEPYLKSFTKSKGIKDLVSVAKIHVEPLGLYSKKVKKLEDLKDNSTIAIPNDPTNEGRALILLDSTGLIKLKDRNNLTSTPDNIVENKHNIIFKEIDAAQLPRVLDDVDASIINGNYALEAGLSPVKDSILLEGIDSPYANILVVKKNNVDNPAIKKLIEALHSDKVKKYISERYNEGIVAAF